MAGLPDERVQLAQGWSVIVGLFLFLFGWLYPHFLDTASFVPYLYAAPTGLVPCPTLSIVIGFSLLVGSLNSRAWALVLGAVGLFYGMFGVLRLGVTMDWVLLFGALLTLLMLFGPNRPCKHRRWPIEQLCVARGRRGMGMTYQGFDAKLAENQWKSLYRVAGVAALISALLIPIQIVVFLAFPLPDSVIGWFALFQSHRLIGLIDLDLLLVADNVLLIPIFLALYVLLRRTSEWVMALGTVLGLVGLVLLIVSNPAIEMLALSDGYAAATTDEQQGRSHRPVD